MMVMMVMMMVVMLMMMVMMMMMIVEVLCLMSPQLGSAATRVSSQVSLLKPTREFWLFNLSYKEHKLIAYKRLII